MATIYGVVKAGKAEKDNKGRPYAQIQDQDTGQFLTLYGRKDLKIAFKKHVGKKVIVNGTLHPLYDSVKVIVTEITPAE